MNHSPFQILLLFFLILLPSSVLAWPTTNQWTAVPKGGEPIHDPTGDAQGARNIVPDNGTLSAAYVYNDGVNLYFRFRLDADPTGQGGQGYLQPYGWGFEIDTDSNADDYEWLMMCDGINSPEIVALRENTEKSHLGDPSDVAEYIAAQYPLAGNFRILAAESCFDSQNNPGGACNAQYDYRDYFLDYKLPYLVFKSATGITDQTLIRFFVGSSSAANNLTENGADLVSGSDLYAGLSDYVTPFGTLLPTTTFHDGSVRFVDDLNGFYDRNLATPGGTIYLRVDDLDLDEQTNPSGEVTVTVTSPAGDTERVTLHATGVRGKYTGQLPTSGTGNSAGVLYILSGQTATATYLEAVAASHTQNVARTDSIFFTAGGTDIGISKSIDQSSANEGETVVFTVTATNNGPSAVTALSIADIPPTGLTLLAATPSQGSYASGTWTVGSLAEGASAMLQLNFSVDSGTFGQTLTNTASILASTPSDTYASNNSASADLIIGGTDLRVSKAVDQPLPFEGDNVVYTVRVLNLGPADTDGVHLLDLLPAGLSYVGHTSSRGSYDPGSGEWDVGSLTTGTGGLLRVTASVDVGRAGQTIANTAVLSASTAPDTTPGNDSASAEIRVGYLDLALRKQVRRYAPATSPFAPSIAADVGATVEFSVTLQNNGPHDATGVTVTDLLPSGLTYVAASAAATHGSYSPATGIWSIGSLGDGDTATLTLRATVDAGTVGLTLVNEAEITAVTQPDSSPGDEYATARVTVGGTDLAVVKSASTPTPAPGGVVTWTVTVTNNGPNRADGVVITDFLPAGVSFVVSKGKVIHTVTQGAFSSGTWTVGTLPYPGTATLTFDTTVNAGTTGQTITNVAFITAAAQTDPDESNNTASAFIAVDGTDLALSKEVDDTTPNIGQQIVYTLTVVNNGPNAAGGIIVNDLLPPEILYASHAFSPSPTSDSYNPATGVWTFAGTLDSGASRQLRITATVLDEDQHLLITNKATVTATQADQNPDNNSARADVTINATDLALSKTVSNATPGEGTHAIYTVTVRNNSPNAATGVEIEDILPAGVTYVNSTSSQGSYSAGLWLVGTLAGGESATLAITIRPDAGTAGRTLTNRAILYALDQIDIDQDNDTATVDIMPQTPANVTLVKLAQNVGRSGYDIPGETVRYTLIVSNFDTRAIDSDSILLVDPIPENTELVVTEPAVTVSNVPSVTGLTLNYGGIGDTGDQVEFSQFASGSDFSYQPADGGIGSDGNVRRIRFVPTGSMNAAGGGTNPNFIITFDVRIK